MACTGWVIPSADPDRDFTRAVGAYWGEDTVARELPTRTLATFTVWGPDEAHLRALVKALIAELRPHDYRLDRGPNSNSFIRLLLDKLHLLAPAANAEDLLVGAGNLDGCACRRMPSPPLRLTARGQAHQPRR
jgi:hypothetical protein